MDRLSETTRRLIVRNGTVVDGSGMPGFRADVEIVDGKIARVGFIPDAPDAESIDATGLVVAPGFVDLHTHYDAQLHFEPTASPSPWHGFTTVAIGNCGFSLAPCKPEDVDWTLNMLSRVEEMSGPALREGVTFKGGSVGDFLRNLEGRIGVNVAAYVGHCALRRWVMGADASRRAATPDEIAAMVDLFEQQLDEGAIGLSTSQLDLHLDHQGLPVPSNLATADEIVALAATLGKRTSGAIEIFPRTFVPGLDDADAELVMRIAEASGKPVHGNVLGYFPTSPNGWRRNLEVAEAVAAKGLRYHPMLLLNPKGVHFTLDTTFIFDDLPTWQKVLMSPPAKRAGDLTTRAVRDALQKELPDNWLNWDEIVIVDAKRAELKELHGRNIASLAEGTDPFDKFLDLALADDLKMTFAIHRKSNEHDRAVANELVRHPLLTMGSSDGGAHLQTFCGVDYPTKLIAEHVPDRLSLEEAIARLTFFPASSLGLWDRGLIRPGMAGDIVILDPSQVAVSAVEMRHDLPTGASRLVFKAMGYHATIVNGEIVVRDGVPTGALPGAILRAGAAQTKGAVQ